MSEQRRSPTGEGLGTMLAALLAASALVPALLLGLALWLHRARKNLRPVDGRADGASEAALRVQSADGARGPRR
jgi:uncharacterized iron-regulated membrane protein